MWVEMLKGLIFLRNSYTLQRLASDWRNSHGHDRASTLSPSLLNSFRTCSLLLQFASIGAFISCILIYTRIWDTNRRAALRCWVFICRVHKTSSLIYLRCIFVCFFDWFAVYIYCMYVYCTCYAPTRKVNGMEKASFAWVVGAEY